MDPAVSVNGQTPVTDQGSPITFSFYDNLGQVYTAKMNVYKPNAAAGAAGTPGQYEVTLADVFDEDGNSIFVQKTTKTDTSTTLLLQLLHIPEDQLWLNLEVQHILLLMMLI